MGIRMNGAGGTARLTEQFTALKARRRKALIIYLMAGDPTPEFTVRLVSKLAAAGADIVELGFPFSDPVADGPVIQASGQRAFPHLSDLPTYFSLMEKIRGGCDLPLVCMTYYNPIFRYGERNFLQQARKAGLDGAILPDLPIAEGAAWSELCREEGMAGIFLEAPNSEEGEVRAIAAASQGFVYLVSLKGVTGSDKGVGENLAERIERLRSLTETPLAVGFGISTPEQAGTFGAMCDGVVVGSGVISRIEAARTPAQGEKAGLDYVAAMRAALDGAA